MKKYIWLSTTVLVVVFTSYFIQFYIILDLPLSKDQEVWAQLGDFLGGFLNPIFGLITIVLLIQSLKLQNEANTKLIEQIDENNKTEKLKSFENLFFNLIEVKRGYFSQFNVEFDIQNLKKTFTQDVAVHKIEIIIAKLKQSGRADAQITELLDELNHKHNIFSQVRCFYVIVKLIDERLNVNNGFTHEDRKAYFKLLINFTEFAHLRLIVMSMQFLKFESTSYLNKNDEFKDVLDELNLTLNPY